MDFFLTAQSVLGFAAPLSNLFTKNADKVIDELAKSGALTNKIEPNELKFALKNLIGNKRGNLPASASKARELVEEIEEDYSKSKAYTEIVIKAIDSEEGNVLDNPALVDPKLIDAILFLSARYGKKKLHLECLTCQSGSLVEFKLVKNPPALVNKYLQKSPKRQSKLRNEIARLTKKLNFEKFDSKDIKRLGNDIEMVNYWLFLKMYDDGVWSKDSVQAKAMKAAIAFSSRPGKKTDLLDPEVGNLFYKLVIHQEEQDDELLENLFKTLVAVNEKSSKAKTDVDGRWDELAEELRAKAKIKFEKNGDQSALDSAEAFIKGGCYRTK